jgi:hypothetical protein
VNSISHEQSTINNPQLAKVPFPPLHHLLGGWSSFSWKAVQKLFISTGIVRAFFIFFYIAPVWSNYSFLSGFSLFGSIMI